MCVQYVAAAGLQHPEDFFSSPAALQLYQNHQKALANRVNTVNGRMYKNEPAILAWDLINEPRSGCDISHANATCDAAETAAIQVGPQTHMHKYASAVTPQFMSSGLDVTSLEHDLLGM